MATKQIKYKGETILFTAGFYWYMACFYRTLAKAKKAIDNKLQAKEHGLL